MTQALSSDYQPMCVITHNLSDLLRHKFKRKVKGVKIVDNVALNTRFIRNCIENFHSCNVKFTSTKLNK